jgi:hypothetical protein
MSRDHRRQLRLRDPVQKLLDVAFNLREFGFQDALSGRNASLAMT